MVDVFTDSNFQEEVLDSDCLTLVDFWAPWCGPCRIQGPIIEALSSEMEDVKLGKLNVDENPQSAAKYGIMSIPTIKFFKDGELVGETVGLQNKESLVEKIEELK